MSAYKPTSDQELILESKNWVNKKQFYNYVISLQYLQVNKVFAKTSSHDTFVSLLKFPLPKDGTDVTKEVDNKFCMIHLGEGDWPRKINSLMDHLLSNNDNRGIVTDAEGHQNSVKGSKTSDERQAYRGLVRLMMDEIQKNHFVYDKAKFDATFKNA